jgi:hypothetical protein
MRRRTIGSATTNSLSPIFLPRPEFDVIRISAASARFTGERNEVKYVRKATAFLPFSSGEKAPRRVRGAVRLAPAFILETAVGHSFFD